MVIERRTEAGDDIRRGGGGGTIGEADSNLIADGWWCVRACVKYVITLPHPPRKTGSVFFIFLVLFSYACSG